METWGCSIFRQEDNYQLVDNTTWAIWLPINKIRTRHRSTMLSLGYQLCVAWLTSPRRLIFICESKNTSKNKREHYSIKEIFGLSTRMWGFTNQWRQNCFWQINLSKTQTLMVWQLLYMKTLQDPLDAPLMGFNTIQGPKTKRHRHSAGTDSGRQLV